MGLPIKVKIVAIKKNMIDPHFLSLLIKVNH